jgi:catechol 2,3-dioxygenase-like lactoylglutathione lyase family enzyme
MDFLLEVVQVPVSDVDRAKEFYAEKAGFNLDHDSSFPNGMRVVQLTPPGSGCSIVIGTGLADMRPGSIDGLQLVVSDIRAARDRLAEQGVDISEVQVVGADGIRASHEEDALDNVGFAFFKDPDGNGWSLQQISARGRGSGFSLTPVLGFNR